MAISSPLVWRTVWMLHGFAAPAARRFDPGIEFSGDLQIGADNDLSCVIAEVFEDGSKQMPSTGAVLLNSDVLRNVAEAAGEVTGAGGGKSGSRADIAAGSAVNL